MKKFMRKLTVLSVMTAMAFSFGIVPSSAATGAPKIEDIDYEGSGVVDVEFRGDVKFGKTKITVKDNKGKKYKAKVIKKDDDDIKFKIKKYKKGRTYTFKIKRVKKWNAGAYKTVKGKVKIKKASKRIGIAKAKQIALNKAGLTAGQVHFTKAKLDYDDGRYVYDIEFYYGNIEYEFEILAKNGRILEWDKDYD